MSRLAALVPDDLDSPQREVYAAITGGPRAAGRQLFALTDEAGALNGPFGVMLHAPGVGLALQELGAAIRYRTDLTDRSREIAILTIAVACESEFEWYAHERVGRAAGLEEAELGALAAGTFATSDAEEAAVVRLTGLLLESPSGGLDSEEHAELVSVLGDKKIIELTTLVGYYRTLAQLMGVFAIGAPREAGPLPETSTKEQ